MFGNQLNVPNVPATITEQYAKIYVSNFLSQAVGICKKASTLYRPNSKEYRRWYNRAYQISNIIKTI